MHKKILFFFIIFFSFAKIFLPQNNIDAIYLKIKDCFTNNDFSQLEDLLPSDRKIYFFIPQIIDKNRYFTSQQLHFILKDMEKNISTQDFLFEKKSETYDNKSTRKARWSFKKDGELFNITLFFNLLYINNEWKIIEVKIS